MDRLVWTSSGVFILLAAFVLLMLFFGSAPQRKVASDLLRTLRLDSVDQELHGYLEH